MRVVSFVLLPLLLGMGLHLHLKHIIFFDAILLQIRQTRVFDDDSGRHVVRDRVGVDLSRSILLSQQPTGVVVHNLVFFDHAVRVNKHNSIEVVLDDVLVNQKLVFSLDNEDTLTLGVLNPIELNLSFT